MPPLYVRVGDHALPLEFDGDTQLLRQVEKWVGKTVRIRGVMEKRSYGGSLKPRPYDGPVPAIDRIRTVNVLVVDHIEVANIHWIREIKKVPA